MSSSQASQKRRRNSFIGTSISITSGTSRWASAKVNGHGPTSPWIASARLSNWTSSPARPAENTATVATSKPAAIQRRTRGSATTSASVSVGSSFALPRPACSRGFGCQGHLGKANTSASAATLSQPSHSVMPTPLPSSAMPSASATTSSSQPSTRAVRCQFGAGGCPSRCLPCRSVAKASAKKPSPLSSRMPRCIPLKLHTAFMRHLPALPARAARRFRTAAACRRPCLSRHGLHYACGQPRSPPRCKR